MADSIFSSATEVKQKLLLLGSGSATITAGQTRAVTTIPHTLGKAPFVDGIWSRDQLIWHPLGQTNDGVFGTAGGDLNSQWKAFADKQNIYLEIYCWSVNAAFTAYFKYLAFELETF